jgi:type IV pilus assembly protein PilN
MLRINLSTRPFYNERGVHIVLALIALVVVLVTAFNVIAVVALSGRNAAQSLEASRADARTRELLSEADRLRRAIDRNELESISTAARDANAILDRRSFSWTQLFNRLEATLPHDVRVTAVRPAIDRQGVVIITINVVARSVGDIDEFIESLEASGDFGAVLAHEESSDAEEEGTVKATLRGRYAPAPLGGGE